MEEPLEPAQLDFVTLLGLVGPLLGERVVVEVAKAGFHDLRPAHGRIFQHLLRGPQPVGQLAGLLGISPQAVSRSVRELVTNGYVDVGTGPDARVREVALSTRGRAAIAAARAARREVIDEIAARRGRDRVQLASDLLIDVLADLGALEPALARTLRMPAD
ncbi:MAG: winged helix-turn-helix transcriptional regulator [Solirubrobacteraceae bacterium]|nr:winged helix-turn-helix transcriptional regulator [Solirubrobacteraceae bacterium]